MNSKLLTLVTFLFVTSISFSQVNVNYETGGQAFTLGTNGGVTIHETATNPNPSGINTSANVSKITETAGAQNWDFATWFAPNFGLNAANGHFISFKYLSETETNLTINFLTRHWDAALGMNQFNDIQKTVTVTANTWNEIEFDFSGETYNDNWTTMFAIQFNKADGVRDGDVYYIDDILQSTTAVLGVNNVSSNKIKIYPNPTSKYINISGLNDNKSITIYNVLGQEVKQFETKKTIDISSLVKGVYFLKTDNGYSKKIIKK